MSSHHHTFRHQPAMFNFTNWSKQAAPVTEQPRRSGEAELVDGQPEAWRVWWSASKPKI
jgi:hypothetical protein